MTAKFLVHFALLVLVGLISACGAPAATAPTSEKYLEPGAQVYEEPAAPAAEYESAPAEEGLAAPAPHSAPDNDPADDMFFKDYGVNPMVDVEDDNLSTFALDVDTGSYTVARSYVMDGNIPPTDAVRVEEFINYFEQGYPFPPERRAFGIHIDGAPSPFAQTERYEMMRVGIQGYEVPEDERKDVSLTFVIDVSGSMDMDNRLELVKRSLELLVERLGRRDRVSIVVYGSDARVVLEPTPGDEQDIILRAIRRLRPEGSTNAEAGLRLGYQMASEAFNSEAINRVVLCSDGVANVGATGAGSIWEEIERYAREGITLTSIGFGMDNYNDVLMEQLADNGDGFYAYVDDIKEAERLFVDDLTSTLQVIAMNAKVQVEFNPEVVARYRLVGYENRDVADEDFRENDVDAGEIGAGHSVTALYEIKLYPEAEGRIATVFLRWQDPDTGEVVELSSDFNANEMERDFEDADPYFQWTVIVAEYAEVLRDSYWARESSFGDVLVEARRVADELIRDPDVEEFVELVRKANRLDD
ncbi:MAG: VWA domain-containing protein [Chloroflexi bacterium HGW-Chloroflexi-6]|nr:MAG: VWA domain-containing protein [Chloroflexi bacterium HGW-Chloroflexi-6]